MGDIQVVLISLTEQREIVAGLARELISVNTAISRLESEIELIREYHARLLAHKIRLVSLVSTMMV